MLELILTLAYYKTNNSLSFILFVVTIHCPFIVFVLTLLITEQDRPHLTQSDNETERKAEFKKDQRSQIFAEVCNLVDQ